MPPNKRVQSDAAPQPGIGAQIDYVNYLNLSTLVYVYPARKRGRRRCHLWARQSELAGGLEQRLTDAVKQWIAKEWPFQSVAYPGRSISWDDDQMLPGENR